MGLLWNKRWVQWLTSLSLVCGVAGLSTAPALGASGVPDRGFGTRGLATLVRGPDCQLGSFETYGSGLLGGRALAQVICPSVRPGSSPSAFLARLTVDGELDPSFGAGGKIDLTSIFTPPSSGATVYRSGANDGKVLVGGVTCGSTEGGVCRPPAEFRLLRLNPDGTPDQGFGENGGVEVPVRDPYIESIEIVHGGPLNESIYINSTVHNSGPGPFGPNVVSSTRLRPDGTVDRAFGADGTATIAPGDSFGLIPSSAAFFIDSVAPDSPRGVWRYSETGAADPAFGGSGFAGIKGLPFDLAPARDGGVVVGSEIGSSTENTLGVKVSMLTASGRLDGKGQLRARGMNLHGGAVQVYSSGKQSAKPIVEGGIYETVSRNDTVVQKVTGLFASRLNRDGSVDRSFGDGGFATLNVDLGKGSEIEETDGALYPEGAPGANKVLVAGVVHGGANGEGRVIVARFTK